MSGPPEDRNPSGSDDDRRRRRKSPPAVVGPSDVAEDVKEVLRAAFEVPDVDPATRSGVAAADRPRTQLDATGPVDVMAEHSDAVDVPDAGTRTRRRFRDIAREHDSRIKGEHSVIAVPRKEEASKPATDTAKKRVVITDEEVVNIKRGTSPQERRPKKTRRRRTEEVTRLPSRRWWTRTAEGRWRLRWYSVVGVVFVALLLVLLVLTSPLLSVRNIVVEGNVYTNQTRLDEVLTQLKGDAILTADLHGAERQIEAIPWVRKVRISMHLPSRIVVQIDEREPVAYFRSVDGFIRVVDRTGRVLDVIEGDPVDFVRIIGSGPNLAPGDFAVQPFLGVVELLGALPADLRDRLVSATVSPEGEISLQLTPNLSIIFGQPTDFQVKLVAVVNEMKRQGSRSYTVIDVSTGEPNVR